MTCYLHRLHRALPHLLVVPMIICGKEFRIIYAKRHAEMAEQQLDARAI
jgi:hypothetical protein